MNQLSAKETARFACKGKGNYASDGIDVQSNPRVRPQRMKAKITLCTFFTWR